MTDCRATILVVDDQPENRLILEDLLQDDYELRIERDGASALRWLDDGGAPDLILLDVVMPGLDGYEVCRRLKRDARTGAVPVLFLTSLDGATDEERGLSLGAEDFIHKPISAPVVLARIRNHLKLARALGELRERNVDLERRVEERSRALLQQASELIRREEALTAAQGATITALCSLAEVRDTETGYHVLRTQHYVRLLATRLAREPAFADVLDESMIGLLFRTAPLHDIGKVAIPDAILQKPGPLTAEERAIMRRHTDYGRDALLRAEAELTEEHGSFLRVAREIAYGHHEWWNGEGYPQGIAGDAIPVGARLMAVADVYDAMISERVYKPAWPHERAIATIVQAGGTQFDPRVIAALVDVEAQFAAIARQYADAPRPAHAEAAAAVANVG